MKSLIPLALSLLAVVPLHGAVIPTDGVELLIPVAGRVAGAGGEFFMTDLTLVNLSGYPQPIALTWLPHGGTAAPRSQTLVLSAFAHHTLIDVVGTTLAAQGLGAILIRSYDPSLAPQPPRPVAIDAEARIWAESTSGSIRGTVSQSVPAIRLEGWRDSSPAYVHGVRQSSFFRTNYGVVNLGAEPREFRVLVNSALGRIEERITVAAFGTLHRRVRDIGSTMQVAGTDDVGLQLSIYVEPLQATAAGTWRAYASTTDNQSGSGWTVIAIQPRTDLQF